MAGPTGPVPAALGCDTIMRNVVRIRQKLASSQISLYHAYDQNKKINLNVETEDYRGLMKSICRQVSFHS